MKKTLISGMYFIAVVAGLTDIVPIWLGLEEGTGWSFLWLALLLINSGALIERLRNKDE